MLNQSYNFIAAIHSTNTLLYEERSIFIPGVPAFGKLHYQFLGKSVL